MEEADRSHICPVCRKHKFKWFNASEECSVCGWIDDAVQEKYPDWGGCQNDMSLNEARKAFEKSGGKCAVFGPGVAPPKSRS